MTLYSIAFSLFILMDAVGNVPIFLSLLKEINPARQRKVIFREMIIALIVMVLFYFVGDLVLTALQVSEETVLVAGGIILFLIALKMIFPTEKDSNKQIKAKEPFIVPLAIPLVAGPGVLASIMLYAQRDISAIIVVTAIIIAWILSSAILISSSWIQHILGPRALTALERLMGLILTLIAVQMFLEGLRTCFTHP